MAAPEPGLVMGAFVIATLLFPVAIFILMLPFGFIVVDKNSAVVVERFGVFHRKLGAGLHFLVPVIDRVRTVTWRYAETFVSSNNSFKTNLFETELVHIDLREAVLDFPNQSIITRDNVEIQVHPLLLHRFSDPVRACYETYDLGHAVEKLVQTTLRSIIGDMSLDDTLASREEINRSLLEKLSHVCESWGVKITSVEVLEIVPSPSIQEAMHKQLTAERVRRAVIVESEGHRNKTKLEAEGDCQAAVSVSKGRQQVAVLQAQAVADTRVIRAKAEAQAIAIIADALKDLKLDVTQYLVANKYMEALATMACQAKTRDIYFPLETDVGGAISFLH